jgi:hypothetical protein
MEFRQLGGSGFNAYLSLLAPAGFRGAKSVADSVVSEGSSLCLGGARRYAKAGAFAYGGKRQRLEPSLTTLSRQMTKFGFVAIV